MSTPREYQRRATYHEGQARLADDELGRVKKSTDCEVAIGRAHAIVKHHRELARHFQHKADQARSAGTSAPM